MNGDGTGGGCLPPQMLPRRELRESLRARRRALSDSERRSHDRKLTRRIRSLLDYRRASRVAFYISADGEIDPSLLMAAAWTEGKRCFLPVLRRPPRKDLWFLEHGPRRPLQRNRFGILEPPLLRDAKRVPPWALDIVLMPLVAFDVGCNRLGMGGGFYDRTLAFRARNRYWLGPMLIGLAHECQKVDRIEARPWDIALDAICTEASVYWRSG